MFADTALTTVDTRPYFERVLCHARLEGLVDATRLDALRREGAKGIVQLATYFGTPNLRPELEAARTRLVTLVSLALEAESGGKIDLAGRLLRDKTLLALSKAGADRLRKLHSLPTERLLGAPEIFRESERISSPNAPLKPRSPTPATWPNTPAASATSTTSTPPTGSPASSAWSGTTPTNGTYSANR